MFYSHLLLSKKGALGIVWMAAHCHKRLKKDQVQQINVSASVDKILDEEVPVVTHRILAFLLLGVVRIYSKKVEYLYDDCQCALDKLCGSSKAGKSKCSGIGAPQKYFQSIALPNSFELDAFDLELFEDQDLVGGNVRSHDQLMLAEVRQKDRNAHALLCKENTTNARPRDVFSPYSMNKALFMGPVVDMKISLADMEILQRTDFYLEDRMDPMVLDEDEEEQMHNEAFKVDPKALVVSATKEMGSDSIENLSNCICNMLSSLEILRGAEFFSEDQRDPTVLDGAGKEQTNDKPSDNDIRTDFLEPIPDVEFNHAVSPLTQGSNLLISSGILQRSGVSLEDCPSLKLLSEAEKGQSCNGVTEIYVENLQTQLSLQEDDELHNFPETVNNTQPVTVNKRKVLEVIPPDSRNCPSMDGFPTSIVALDPKLPDTGSPKVAHILTPAGKEHKKILRKRRILFDSTTILPNRVIKRWIEEVPNDLKRKRKKFPTTLLQAWRSFKLGDATQRFMEPLISGISEDLGFLHCERSCAAAISAVELSASPDDAQSPVTHGVNEQILDVRSPVTQRSPEQTPIAPRTPISHLIPLRSHEIGTTADSDFLEPSTSIESIEKSSSSSDRGLELDAAFCEETNFCNGDSLEKHTYSARTRILGSCLHRKFMAKRRKAEEEVLNVSQLLEGKTKRESARIFYEILVLKSRDSVDVQQENAYDDIMLWGASK